MMKRKLCKLIFLFVLLIPLVGCSVDDNKNFEPIAPILKSVVMPLESATFPGKVAEIQGLGFCIEDEISCVSLSNEKDFSPAVVGVTDAAISILIPDFAAGAYKVSVTRAGLTSQLGEQLNVAYVVVIDDLVLPQGNIASGSTIEFLGDGFEDNDQIILGSNVYPENHTISVVGTKTADGYSIVVPEGVYGVNSVLLKRGQRQGQLGDINIAVSVGDEIGGGVVYYVSDGGIHGLIAAKENVGSPVEKWGPEVEMSMNVGTTSCDIYAGKQNTADILAKFVAYRSSYPEWVGVKVASELCAEYSVTVDGVVYSDWFLPSLNELVELFNQKGMLADKGASMPANNYWTSSEAADDAAGWAACYVNFYEPVNLVTGPASKSGWAIGVRAIRMF